MLHVGGKPSGRVRETVSKSIREAEATGPGSKCEFQLKIPGQLLPFCQIISFTVKDINHSESYTYSYYVINVDVI